MDLQLLQKQEVAEVLSSFGFKENEQVVYLALLRLGPTTATPLARVAELPPTTVESILCRLLAAGVIGATKHRSRHIYEALDPAALKKILEKKLQEVSGIIPLLQGMRKGYTKEAKIRIFYRERFADIFDAAMLCRSKRVYEIVSPKNFQEILGEKYHFTKRRLEHKVFLKSLRVEKYEIKKYSRLTHVRELREAKFLPRECTFGATILFWDTSVALFSSKAEGTAVLIESPLIAEMIQQIFNVFWSISRPMETTKE